MNKETFTQFRVGDCVKCIKSVDFIDSTSHEVGNIFKISKETLAYYNTPCNNVNYELHERLM